VRRRRGREVRKGEERSIFFFQSPKRRRRRSPEERKENLRKKQRKKKRKEKGVQKRLRENECDVSSFPLGVGNLLLLPLSPGRRVSVAFFS